jgi:hypothetical protein
MKLLRDLGVGRNGMQERVSDVPWHKIRGQTINEEMETHSTIKLSNSNPLQILPTVKAIMRKLDTDLSNGVSEFNMLPLLNFFTANVINELTFATGFDGVNNKKMLIISKTMIIHLTSSHNPNKPVNNRGKQYKTFHCRATTSTTSS